MAIPATPRQFVAQQGDGRVALTWSFIAGATSYNVYRSTDNITYAVIASPTVTQYEDTSVTLGTIYYYKVSAVQTLDESPLSQAQLIIPTMGGEMSLSELQIRSLQRADRLNTEFVTQSELTSYINQSLYELYDLLIDVYEDYFKAPSAIFTTTGGNQSIYPMPNGVLTFQRQNTVTGALESYVAEPIYKLLGVDMGLNIGNNGWVTINKFNYIDRNKFFFPNSGSTIYGVFNVQYRWLGSNIELIPVPSAGQPIRINYIPRLRQLLLPQDTTTTSISGWLEYVITDVAIKVLVKEESDITALMAQKMALKKRIEESANNRDAGRPDTISDVRGYGWWGRNGMSSNQGGGW